MSIDESWYRKPPGVGEHLAAGGVVVKMIDGDLAVALVHEGELAGYGLPKGHVELNESPEAAARREIREETGLEYLIALGELGVRERLNYTKTSWKRTHYFAFLIAPGHEASIARAAWFPLGALPSMFWPEQRELLVSNRDEIRRRVHLHRGDVKASVQRQFSRRAEAYAQSASHRRDADLERLIDHLQLTPSDFALDIATGTGFTAFALRPRVRSVIGVDLTLGMLEEARRLMPADSAIGWVVGDAETLPFEDGIFTVVTCRRAPHHFPRVQRAIEEMVRVLVLGGRIGIIDQVPPEDDPGHDLMEGLEVLRDSSHVHALRASRWQALLPTSGVVLTFTQVLERRQTVEAWLELAGADNARSEAIAAILGRAPPHALAQIGYEQTPEPSFLKRWIVLVGEKRGSVHG